MQDQVVDLLSQGLNKKQVSERLGIGYSTVRKYSKGIDTSSLRCSLHWTCKVCNMSGKENFYESKKNICKKCWNDSCREHRKKLKRRYLEKRKQTSCQRCGYDRYIGAISFHHRDPNQKDPDWTKNWGWKRMKVELDKCDILCHNCHAEVHEEMRQRDNGLV